MPAYLGGKKVKELYLGGRKIKEAWYGGKKVYSSVGSGVYPWHDRQDYLRGDLVHYQGIVYECIQDHQADGSKTQPGEGWDQYSYWKQVGYVRERNDIKYDPWKYTKYYRSGDKVSATVNGVEGNYQCTSGHYAGIDDRPGGPKGDQYWKFISKSSGSTSTTPPSSGGSTPSNPPTSTPSTWRAGVNYSKGDLVTIDVYGDVYRYTALVDHYSMTDNKPFYGSVENIYWGNPTKVS